MGGEPTFVAVDDMEGAEWNTAAVGPHKRRYADDLIRRLTQRFAGGGLLHYGQGKWYPGEQLPRWAFALYWRTDGQPLWEDKKLIAREVVARPATIADAEKFTTQLCRQLGLPETSAIAAYEDAAHFMLVEQKLPLNVTPATNALADAAERKRIMSVFDRGLEAPVSYVLPIQVWHSDDRGRRWVTERWALRRGKLFLVPGDSPAGFRLPLGSLAVLPAVDYPQVPPRDPFADAPPLPERRALMQRRRAVTLEAPPPPAVGPSDLSGSVRTAMTVEPRDGHLCVFMPPVEDAEDYAALVAVIEETARTTGVPVQVEGYTPPPDPRINVIKVTPGPGRHRGQHPSGAQLGRGRRHHDLALRGGTPHPTQRREVHARRAPHRHRRRQSHRARRPHAGRQPVPAPSRSARLASSPTGRTIPRCPTCSPACSSGRPARRRASTRVATSRSTSWRSRSPRSPIRVRATCRRGWSTACSATC